VRLKESYAFVFLSAFALGTACHDATSPSERHQARIFAIQTSQRAAVTDTIHISFQYSTASPCDSATVLESQLESDGIRLGISSVGPGGVCPIAVTQIFQPPFLYVVGPLHQVPFTVRFAEPGEADSVRVIPGQ
jgi:hypothetical protein